MSGKCSAAEQQREEGHLDRREAGVELEDGPLLAAHLVRAVGRGEHREHQPVDADTRLDDVRHVLLLERVVEVLHALAAGLSVLAQVVVAARRDALQLLLPKGELELDVGAGLRVVG